MGDGMRGRERSVRQGFVFVTVAGLVGEAFEMVHFTVSGTAVPLRLGATLFVAYAVLGLICFLLGKALARGRRSLTLAAVFFALLLLIPELNFYYLPQAASVRSLVGNAVGAVVVIALTSFFFSRFRRGVTLTLCGLVVAANVAQYVRGSQRESEVTVQRSRPEGPNVIVLVIDTLRADHVGVYGYGRGTTPNIDAVAKNGLVFSRAISQASWTKPSMASFLTGQYLRRHGVNNKWDALDPNVRTLGKELQALGYRTAAFSSNPFIAPEFGFQNGFDSFYHTASPSGVQYATLFRLLSRGKSLLQRTTGVSLDLPGLIRKPAEKFPKNYIRDDMLTSELAAFLRRHRDERFFVYAHYIGSHIPYDPPEAYLAPFLPAGWDGRKAMSDHPPQARLLFQRATALPEIELRAMVAHYDGAIAWTDMLIGRVVRTLADLQLENETLLVVTSDHGEEFFDHNNWGHGLQMYNELIHVPLIFHFPGKIAPGRRDDTVMLVDLYPTIAALAGARPAGEQLDGRNLFDGSTVERSFVFSEYYRHDGSSPYQSLAVLGGNRKLIETHDDAVRASRVELFDLERDWAEKDNLAARAGGVATDPAGRQLQQTLAEFAKGGPRVSTYKVKIDADTKERLRALGYH